MKLGFLHRDAESEEIKNQIIKVASKLGESLPKIKYTFSDKQLESLNDALAIAENLKLNFETMKKKDLNRSSERFARLVRACFSEDVLDSDFRAQVKKEQLDNVKIVEPRSVGEGRRLGDTYKDTPTITTGKTASAIDPSLIAERIISDLGRRFYYSAQDAYDGYTEKDGAYLYASASQKVRLAKILRHYGFKIDYAKWEKESQEDYKEWVKLHKDLGKGERKPEDRLIHHSQKEENIYCPHCKKTTKHTNKGEGKYVCKECGREKSERKGAKLSDDAQAFISKKIKFLIDKEGKSQEQAAAIAYNMAREKGFDVPEKKEAQWGNDPRMDLEEGGYDEQIDQDTATEMTKMGGYMYACGKCPYKQRFEKQGDYKCGKCGSMMKYSVEGEDPARVDEYGKIPAPVDATPMEANPEVKLNQTPGVQNDAYKPGGGYSFNNSTDQGNRYMAMINASAKNDDYVNVETVKQVCASCAKRMEENGILRVKAKYLLQVLSQMTPEEVDEEYEDQLPGGVADENTPEDFDAEQISKGIEVEMEHTNDAKLAEEIALDHLAEFPNYYDALEEMEEKLRKEQGSESPEEEVLGEAPIDESVIEEPISEEPLPPMKEAKLKWSKATRAN